MDKRYVLIIIIVVGCCINLFIISNSSDMIGSASVECGNYIFTMPSGFTLYDSGVNHVLIHDSKTGANVDVYSHLDSSDTYENKLSQITNDSYTIVSNGTINVEGIVVKSVYYTKNDTQDNRSTFFFEKDGNRFRVLMAGFNLENDRNVTIDYISEIAQSIKYNYKK